MGKTESTTASSFGLAEVPSAPKRATPVGAANLLACGRVQAMAPSSGGWSAHEHRLRGKIKAMEAELKRDENPSLLFGFSCSSVTRWRNQHDERLQYKNRGCRGGSSRGASAALGGAVDAEHFKKISCLVDFIVQAKEARALFVAQEMSGMLAWGLVPSMFWFGEEEFGHPPGLAAELETGRCQQAGSADSAPDGEVTGDIVPCSGCEGAQAALDGSGDGQPGDKDEGGEELSACDASIGAGHARAASEGFGLGSGDVATRDRAQRPRKVIKHRDRTQKPGRKRVGDRTRKPRRVQQDPLKDQEPVCVAKGYKGFWGSGCFPQGVVQCKVPRDLSPVACRSPGAQVQVGAQAGQVAVLRVRGSCSCLLCQGALSLLHAVRSTGARARSVKSMQEVCASQVRLRSQVHCRVRLRLPSQIWSPVQDKGRLRLSLVPGCSFSAAVGQEHRCESPLGQFHAGSSCQPGQVEVSGAHQPLQHQAQVPSQVWIPGACRSPGAQMQVGAQAGQVAVLRAGGSCNCLCQEHRCESPLCQFHAGSSCQWSG